MPLQALQMAAEAPRGRSASGGFDGSEQHPVIRLWIRYTEKREMRHGPIRYGQTIRLLPRENPCAQCGKPIAVPEWVEAGPRRRPISGAAAACDYRFEAVAVFR